RTISISPSASFSSFSAAIASSSISANMCFGAPFDGTCGLPLFYIYGFAFPIYLRRGQSQHKGLYAVLLHEAANRSLGWSLQFVALHYRHLDLHEHRMLALYQNICLTCQFSSPHIHVLNQSPQYFHHEYYTSFKCPPFSVIYSLYYYFTYIP